MSCDHAISISNLGKCYHIYDKPRDRLFQMFMRSRRQYYREFWALRNVSLDIGKGEVLGIVGKNGAGKSTLLQLFCSTLHPTEGSVVVNGRVAALLELGAGFNPEFSGRENVFLSGTVMGLTRQEITARYDEIVEFSGIGEFIHQPVKTYSSGMYVRLAFAVATSVKPDILVIDEALSVGDGEFARKSFDRILELKKSGATVLFCSHSLYQMEAFCDRVLWLDHGTPVMLGEPQEVLSKYTAFLRGDATTKQGKEPDVSTPEPTPETPRMLSGEARFTSVEVALDGKTGRHLLGRSGASTLKVKAEFASDPSLPAPTIGVMIQYGPQLAVTCAVTRSDQIMVLRDARGNGSVEVTFPDLSLRKGPYQVEVYLGCEQALHFYDVFRCPVDFELEDPLPEPGLTILPHTWSQGRSPRVTHV